MKGEYQARGPKLAAYLAKVRGYLDQFKKYTIEQIPREQNTNADALAKLASTRDKDTLESILVKYLSKPSIAEEKIHMVNSPEESWFAPIVRYLNDGTLPLDKKDARKLAYKAAHYTLVDGALYKRGFSTPLL